MWGRVCMWLTYSNLFCCTLTWGITSKQIKLCNIIIYPKNRVQFWDPKTSFYFAIWPAFPLRLVHPVLRPWILSKPPPLSPTFWHSKSLHVSQSFSSSITREFQKETEKEMGSVTAEYARADIQYFSYVIFYFMWWTQMAKRHTSHTLSHLHNPTFLSNRVAFYFFLGQIFTVWHYKCQDPMASLRKTLF